MGKDPHPMTESRRQNSYSGHHRINRFCVLGARVHACVCMYVCDVCLSIGTEALRRHETPRAGAVGSGY